jgi:hypothetical protein
MQIISKKRLQFQDYHISVNPLNGEKVAKLVRSFHASPSMRPIEVPDWIVNDDLFDSCVADGSVVAIGDIPEKQKKPEPTLEPTQTVRPTNEEDAELQRMLSTPISELTGKTLPAQWPVTKSNFP